MKCLIKITSLTLVCLYMAAGAAEKTDGGSLELGTRLGAQISTLYTDAHWGPYPDISGRGGVFSLDMAYGFSEYFYVHAEVGLDYRNFYTYGEIGIPCASIDGEPCGGNWKGNDEISLFYLEIPLMAQWRTPALFLELGPVFDILLRVDEEYILPEKYRTKRGYKDKRFGTGFAAGLGHIFDFGLSIDLRVSFQFTDVVDDDKKTLTAHAEEYEWHYDMETQETSYRKVEGSNEYMGGSYYKLMKVQFGIGYWF
ncbi:MAG: outer membrane beta-barrel protein [Fibrobacter sp.]|uniref:outer membrane beta-barrel protein n=1 Tax=Fibrobacter sp. TaxID=35828 RepID=UPI0025C2EEA8|nr:outer membrane beta-barrel protein [Fibrobacter sp.]MBR4784558.1 outer membrane beta-barrel protein [Fibrobacter sp.]